MIIMVVLKKYIPGVNSSQNIGQGGNIMYKTVSRDPLTIEFIDWCNKNGLVPSRAQVLHDFMTTNKSKYES